MSIPTSNLFATQQPVLTWKWKLISLNIPKYHYLPLFLKWRLKSPRWPHAASPAHWKLGLLCWLCSDIPSSFIYPTHQTPPTIGHGTCLRGIPNLTCLQTSSWATAPYQLLSASSPTQYIKTHPLCCSVQRRKGDPWLFFSNSTSSPQQIPSALPTKYIQDLTTSRHLSLYQPGPKHYHKSLSLVPAALTVALLIVYSTYSSSSVYHFYAQSFQWLSFSHKRDQPFGPITLPDGIYSYCPALPCPPTLRHGSSCSYNLSRGAVLQAPALIRPPAQSGIPHSQLYDLLSPFQVSTPS